MFFLYNKPNEFVCNNCHRVMFRVLIEYKVISLGLRASDGSICFANDVLFREDYETRITKKTTLLEKYINILFFFFCTSLHMDIEVNIKWWQSLFHAQTQSMT